MNNNKINTSIDELKQQVENLILLKDQIKDFKGKEFDKLISTSEDLTKNIIEFVKKCQNNNSTEQNEFRKKNNKPKASVRNNKNNNNNTGFSEFEDIIEDLIYLENKYREYYISHKDVECGVDEKDCKVRSIKNPKNMIKIKNTKPYNKFMEIYKTKPYHNEGWVENFKQFLSTYRDGYYTKAFSYRIGGLISQLKNINNMLRNKQRGGNKTKKKKRKKRNTTRNKKRHKKKKHTKRYKKRHNKKQVI